MFCTEISNVSFLPTATLGSAFTSTTIGIGRGVGATDVFGGVGNSDGPSTGSPGGALGGVLLTCDGDNCGGCGIRFGGVDSGKFVVDATGGAGGTGTSPSSFVRKLVLAKTWTDVVLTTSPGRSG